MDTPITDPIPPRPIDPSVAQRRASDPGASVWVGASAGTGKTKVLTDRVLRLMLAGTEPARILCLTFTKAAAAEMSTRIAARLSAWAVSDDAGLEADLAALTGSRPTEAERIAARRLFARMLDAPGGMKIQTIHAFCQSLLRRFPVEAGLPPNFEVMDDRTSAEVLRDVTNALLRQALAEPQTPLGLAVALLTRTVNEEDFGKLLGAISAERGRLGRILAQHGGLPGTLLAMRRFLKVAADESEAGILAAAAIPPALDEGALRATLPALLGSPNKSDVAAGEKMAAILAMEAEKRTPRLLDAWVPIFLTAEFQPRAKLPTQKLSASHPEVAEAMGREAIRLATMVQRIQTLRTAAATEAVLTLADALLSAYEAAKSARARLDFDDLIQISGQLLTEGSERGAAAWVLYKLDGGLDHILVDEAQDTNPDQWEVVRALAAEFFDGAVGAGTTDRPRTLFVVGDEKQSIFSFQRADPAVFRRMRAFFAEKVRSAAARWEEVNLVTSFRSVAAVLDTVDAVFQDDAARKGVAEQPFTHAPHRRGMAGSVELWPAVEPAAEAEDGARWTPPLTREWNDKPKLRLAKVLAERIRRWLDDRDGLPARNTAIRPGDIMVLVRRRDAFVPALVRALKDLAVPVAGVDRMMLTGQLAVMDLLVLGDFLALPDDDLALATVLKSPLIGLTEEELFNVAHARKGRLWPALSAAAKAETPPARLSAAREWLFALMRETDYSAPYELFAGVLGRPCPADGDAGGSGRRAMLARLGPEATDPMDEFLSASLIFEREHVPALQGFLAWMRASETDVKRELEAAGAAGLGQVRIMTVHGSKGLQAPIVILPDVLSSPDAPKERLLWPQETEPGGRDIPLYAPRKDHEGPAYAAAKAHLAERQEEEYRRLLYVALTRAEDRLIVCGWRGKKATREEASWFKLTESALARIGGTEHAFDLTQISADGWAGDGRRLVHQQTVPPKTPPQAAMVASAKGPLPPWALAQAPGEPAPSRPLTPSRPSLPEPAMRSPLGASDDRLRFQRGTLIHKLLQILPDLPDDRRRPSAAGWLARPVHGLAPDRQEQILEETMAVLTDPRFTALFGPESRAEVPVVGIVGGRVLSGQIDRLVITPTEVLIIDYKTNRPPPKRQEDVPPAYLSQMSAYRAVLTSLYPDRPVRAVLLWTDGPFTLELTDAALLEFAP